MPAHFENGENVTVAKFELAFTRYQKNLKTVGNLAVRNSLQDFDAIERYLSVNQSCCESVEKCSIFIIFRLHDAHDPVSKMCRLDCVDTMPAHFENGEKCDG